jgi:hypothetical protein
MIDHTWMDDIEIGINVFIASALRTYLLIMTYKLKGKKQMLGIFTYYVNTSIASDT